MSTLDAYKQKVEAELELAQAKLVTLKAEAGNAAADAQIKYAEQIDHLENGVASAKAKLSELSTAGEEAWEHLKDDAESAWQSLSVAVKNATAKLKD
jgi:flagellar biosynthesis chaperone FliJ